VRSVASRAAVLRTAYTMPMHFEDTSQPYRGSSSQAVGRRIATLTFLDASPRNGTLGIHTGSTSGRITQPSHLLQKKASRHRTRKRHSLHALRDPLSKKGRDLSMATGRMKDDPAKGMRQPGVEPGAHRWQRWILPLNHWRFYLLDLLRNRGQNCSHEAESVVRRVVKGYRR
jgi:hypothetical protein